MLSGRAGQSPQKHSADDRLIRVERRLPGMLSAPTPSRHEVHRTEAQRRSLRARTPGTGGGSQVAGRLEIARCQGVDLSSKLGRSLVPDFGLPASHR